MRLDEAVVGSRIRSIRPFAGIPSGCEGVIDEADADGCMVAWDHPESPLPPGYVKYDGRPAIVSHIVRDRFTAYEMRWLKKGDK